MRLLCWVGLHRWHYIKCGRDRFRACVHEHCKKVQMRQRGAAGWLVLNHRERCQLVNRLANKAADAVTAAAPPEPPPWEDPNVSF